MSRIHLDIKPSDRLHPPEKKFTEIVVKHQKLKFGDALTVIVTMFNYAHGDQFVVLECSKSRLVIDSRYACYFKRGMALSQGQFGDIRAGSFCHTFEATGYPNFEPIQTLVRTYLTVYPQFAPAQVRHRLGLLGRSRTG